MAAPHDSNSRFGGNAPRREKPYPLHCGNCHHDYLAPGGTPCPACGAGSPEQSEAAIAAARQLAASRPKNPDGSYADGGTLTAVLDPVTRPDAPVVDTEKLLDALEVYDRHADYLGLPMFGAAAQRTVAHALMYYSENVAPEKDELSVLIQQGWAQQLLEGLR